MIIKYNIKNIKNNINKIIIILININLIGIIPIGIDILMDINKIFKNYLNLTIVNMLIIIKSKLLDFINLLYSLILSILLSIPILYILSAIFLLFLPYFVPIKPTLYDIIQRN